MRSTPAVEPHRFSISSVLVADMEMQAMKIPIRLKTEANAGAQVKALIDSRAQERFIDRRTVRTLGLREIPLSRPISVYNVDGTPNQLGNICNYVNVDVTIGKTTSKERMLVTQLGKQEVILGIDWLKERNPGINWKIGTLDFSSRKVVIEELPDEEEARIRTMETLPEGEILLKKVSPEISIPARGSQQAAGLDITASTATVIPPNGQAKVPTGIKAQALHGTYLRIAPRSELALKGIDVAAGVIDRDYTGEIQAILVNNTSEPFTVQPNDRIAQLITEHIATPQVKIVDKLPTTERGTQGFGSTGLKPPFI